eukprot:767033-Hanusia_phi.AAC.1
MKSYPLEINMFDAVQSQDSQNTSTKALNGNSSCAARLINSKILSTTSTEKVSGSNQSHVCKDLDGEVATIVLPVNEERFEEISKNRHLQAVKNHAQDDKKLHHHVEERRKEHQLPSHTFPISSLVSLITDLETSTHGATRS